MGFTTGVFGVSFCLRDSAESQTSLRDGPSRYCGAAGCGPSPFFQDHEAEGEKPWRHSQSWPNLASAKQINDATHHGNSLIKQMMTRASNRTAEAIFNRSLIMDFPFWEFSWVYDRGLNSCEISGGSPAWRNRETLEEQKAKGHCQ